MISIDTECLTQQNTPHLTDMADALDDGIGPSPVVLLTNTKIGGEVKQAADVSVGKSTSEFKVLID